MRSFFIHTYGCQMNARDSETLAGQLAALGFEPAARAEGADVILFNTCCIRDHAAARVIGNVGALREAKHARPGTIIGVCGCLMQMDDQARKLMLRYPFVDFALCPQTIDRLPEAMAAAAVGERSMFLAADAPLCEGLPRLRTAGSSAFVNIMAGCDNYCSYCVVPFVRGRERSRELPAVLEEVRGLVADGVREITLLGQNVNSYRGAGGFAGLLRAVAAVSGLARVRFMTSNPHDFSDDIIAAIADCPNIARHVHLPVQSGADGVLRAMNRKYSGQDYLGRVAALRAAVPGIALTTDLIAGFPGESQAAHENSLALLEQVGFDAAFVFLYSSRPGTAAAKMEGHLPQETIKARHAELLALQERLTRARDAALEGEVLPVLFERRDNRTGEYLTGKEHLRTVHAPGGDEHIGHIRPVRITRVGTHTLHGEIQQD